MKQIFCIMSLILLFSCDDIIEVPDITDETVTVLAPADGVTLTTASITFNWSNVDDADSYRLQIATPTFVEAQQILADSLITDTNFTITLDSGNYQWRLRAENSEYQTAYITQDFTIEE